MGCKSRCHTLLLSLLHFLVDGICACGVMMMSHQIVSDFEANGMIVLYNVLAFGTQPLTGRWVDEHGVCPRGLKLAVALLIAGALVSSISTSHTIFIAVPGAILLGMGNSLFHVYGGKYVAIVSHNDIRAMGVFVSTGAVGLAIGVSFSSSLLLATLLIVFLILSATHLHNAYRQNVAVMTCPSFIKETSIQSLSDVPIFFLSSLMLVVAGRAFIGESVPSLHASIHSMSTPLVMVMVSIIVMVGKAAGGFLCKWWGLQKVFYFSMLLSGTTFLICPWHDGFVLMTLFLINLSMPCTLYLATKAVPGREGWTFGLLAAALLPGFLLGYLTKYDVTCQELLVPLMATIILESLLLLCMRERRWQVLAISVLLNICTNVPLNVFVMAYNVISPLYLVGLECVVVAVELVGYWSVLHHRGKALKYSLLCNSFSALVGCFCQFVIS